MDLFKSVAHYLKNTDLYLAQRLVRLISNEWMSVL